METTTAKNKTLVKISKEVADQISEMIAFSALGLSSDGGFTTYQYHLDALQIKLAQKALDEIMDAFYSDPSNSDGGSPDDRYRILLNVASRFDIDEQELSN